MPDTVVEPVTVTYWEPVCSDRFGSNSAAYPDVDPSLDEFSTVGTRPTLDLALPEVTTVNGVVQPLLSASMIPDGVLLVVYENAQAPDGQGVDVASVAAVDLDGSLRWRRCFEGDGWFGGSALSTDDPTRVWIVMSDFSGSAGHLRSLDLLTGADADAPIELGDRVVVGGSGPYTVLGLRWTADMIAADDELVVFDATDGSQTSIAYPATAVGQPPDAVEYQVLREDGRLVIGATPLGEASPAAVFVDGRWSSDPADLRRLPPTLHIPFGGDEGLQLIDGAGEIAWSVPGFQTIGREGFSSAVADSVALVMQCMSWSEADGCAWVGDEPPEERLVAFDLGNGDELWHRDGGQSFAAIVGDRGIITADLDEDGSWDAWELIDLRTGERVTDQPVVEWPDTTIFANECCGGGDYVWTRVDGGVLVESLGDRVHLWLPPDLTTEEVTARPFG